MNSVLSPELLLEVVVLSWVVDAGGVVVFSGWEEVVVEGIVLELSVSGASNEISITLAPRYLKSNSYPSEFFAEKYLSLSL